MIKIKNTNLKFNGNLTPINKSRITKIVQHHMAHKTWHLNDVHNYHKNGNGWAGIGYNYWIDFEGNIYKGRGMNVGAHASGHNNTTIGIGYQGDFTTQTMPEAQLDAGVALNKWLMEQLPNKVSIVGHRDVGNTACPGQNFKMDELKKGVDTNTSSEPSKPSKPSTSKPKPKSNPTLRRGSKGQYVRELQTKLVNKDYSVGKHGVDGVFGEDVERAVRSLQKDAEIAIDGVVGKDTWRVLNSDFTKPKSNAKPKGDMKTNSVVDYLNSIKVDSSFNNRKKLASKHGIKGYKGTASQNATLLSKLRKDNGVKSTDSKKSKKYPLPNVTLRRGSKGNNVKQLQRALNAANFKVGKSGTDGVYGKDTEDAVRRFQKVHLPYEVDGVAGKNTYGKLNKIVNK